VDDEIKDIDASNSCDPADKILDEAEEVGQSKKKNKKKKSAEGSDFEGSNNELVLQNESNEDC